MMYSRCTGAHRRRRIACCRTVPGRGPVHRATQAGVASRRTPTGERRREGRTSTTGPAAILAGTRRRPARWWTSFATTRSKSRASSWRSLPSRALVTVAERGGYLSFSLSLSPLCACVQAFSRDPTARTKRGTKTDDERRWRSSFSHLVRICDRPTEFRIPQLFGNLSLLPIFRFENFFSFFFSSFFFLE